MAKHAHIFTYILHTRVREHYTHTEPARPFDFIIHGELVRKSLEAHLTEHQLSAVGVRKI
jgi:hypothetical protein